MNDGVPTPEQLARIQRGVMGRIDRRRAIGRRIAGTAVAVAVVGGGFGLVGPVLGTSGAGGASAGGSAASTADSGAAGGAETVVLCHTGTRRDSPASEAFVDPAALPAAAAQACAAVDLQSGGGRMPSAAEADPADVPTTTSGGTPGPGAALAVCRAPDGVLHAYPLPVFHDDDDAAATLCMQNGMTDVSG